MRKFLAVLFVICLVASADARPTLTVRAFDDESENGDAPAGAIMNMMVTELYKAGLFNLVEREKLHYVYDEIRLAQRGLMDMSTAPNTDKLTIAKYTMTGAITAYHYHEKGNKIAIPVLEFKAQAKTAYVMLDIRIIDNETSETVYAENMLGESKQAEKGAAVKYKGFFIGSYNNKTGGILATATRNAVMKHVAALKLVNLEE